MPETPFLALFSRLLAKVNLEPGPLCIVSLGLITYQTVGPTTKNQQGGSVKNVVFCDMMTCASC
jgi:hypothetical protein